VGYNPFEWCTLETGDEEDGKLYKRHIALELIEPLAAEFKGIVEIVEDDGIRYLVDRRHTPRS